MNNRKKKGDPTPRKNFRYFYLNGKLHKLLYVTRARDEALAWCYSEHKKILYPWSEVRRRASRGFTIGQVGKMVNRQPRMIRYYVEWGLMEWPEQTYSLTSGHPGMHIFSEEDVFKVRDIVADQRPGTPRKDGLIRPRPVASKQEIYAQMKHDMVLYAKNKDGEFVPLYMAEDW